MTYVQVYIYTTVFTFCVQLLTFNELHSMYKIQAIVSKFTIAPNCCPLSMAMVGHLSQASRNNQHTGKIFTVIPSYFIFNIMTFQNSDTNSQHREPFIKSSLFCSILLYTSMIVMHIAADLFRSPYFHLVYCLSYNSLHSHAGLLASSHLNINHDPICHYNGIQIFLPNENFI